MKGRFFFILLIVASCKEFNLQKMNETRLVEEELKAINWNAVDQYPAFEFCDTLSGESQEQCFKSFLVAHFSKTLSKADIVVSEDLNDTLMLRLRVSHDGQISIPNISAKLATREAIPQLDSLMTKCLSQLPKIYPAIKRGQQVSTEFQLPVVLVIK
jgi:hypothetical protein